MSIFESDAAAIESEANVMFDVMSKDIAEFLGKDFMPAALMLQVEAAIKTIFDLPEYAAVSNRIEIRDKLLERLNNFVDVTLREKANA